MDTSLTYKPHISAYWEREHMIHVSGHLGFLLSSKNQLKPFANSEEVKKTTEVEVEKPDIISPVFHLMPTKAEPKFETGFYSSPPFPYPHTFIIVCDEKKWSTSRSIGHGKGVMLKLKLSHS